MKDFSYADEYKKLIDSKIKGNQANAFVSMVERHGHQFVTYDELDAKISRTVSEIKIWCYKGAVGIIVILAALIKLL